MQRSSSFIVVVKVALAVGARVDGRVVGVVVEKVGEIIGGDVGVRVRDCVFVKDGVGVVA